VIDLSFRAMQLYGSGAGSQQSQVPVAERLFTAGVLRRRKCVSAIGAFHTD